MIDPLTGESWFTRKRIITMAVCLALAAGGAFSAKPAYRAFKKWRAHKFCAEGEALIAAGKWDQALRKAQQASQLSRSDGRTMRLMARILTTAGHEQALPYWKELLKTGEATRADRAALISTALRARDWASARQQLEIELRENPAPEIHRLTSDFYVAQGDLVQGVNFAREAFKAGPNDTTNSLLLAHRLLATQGTNEFREAGALLQGIARTKDGTALDALLLLLARFQPTEAEVLDYLKLIADHPAHTFIHEFYALDVRMKLKPEDRAVIIEQACAKYTALGDEALVQLGRWLNRHQEHALTVKHIPLTHALRSQDLFLLHVDALASLKRWTAVEEALEMPRVPLDPFFISLYQVRVALELGRKEAVPINWSLAHSRAAQNTQHLLYLAQYAEKIGALDEAVKAYQRLIELAPQTKAAYIALVRLLEKTAHTREVRDLVRSLVERFPEEAAAQNDLAYLNLLLTENVEAARLTAEQLVRANPAMLAHRTTLALAYLRLQQPAAARKLYEGVNLDWNQVNAGWRTVYAAVLAANNDLESARTIARAIPLAGLRNEERFLIQKLIL